MAVPVLAVGMVCAMLVFIGHFAFFTYLRPFLEFTTGAGVATISSVLLGFGVASLFGTLLAGFMLERSLRATLAAMPLVMAVFAASLAASNEAGHARLDSDLTFRLTPLPLARRPRE